MAYIPRYPASELSEDDYITKTSEIAQKTPMLLGNIHLWFSCAETGLRAMQYAQMFTHSTYASSLDTTQCLAIMQLGSPLMIPWKDLAFR